MKMNEVVYVVYMLEKLTDMYDSELFSRMVTTYIRNNDKIKQLSHYVDKYIETPFSYDKRKEYLNTDVIKTVKKELNKFVVKWVRKLRESPDIVEITVNPSQEFGLSDYINITFSHPENLDDFYDANKPLYDSVKFRFSDHAEQDWVRDKAKRKVSIRHKTFYQASVDMSNKIDDYINYLRKLESLYLQSRDANSTVTEKLTIREDCSVYYTDQMFYITLNEFLTRNDEIKYADDYIDNFDKSKKQKYAKEYPIRDIKNDIASFIDDWLNEIKRDCDIYSMKNNRMSDSYGFSNYITLSFNRPADRRLYQFYQDNSEKYNNVKFRFSEHDPKNDTSDIADSVNFVGKTFNQAADEMKCKIENYVIDLRSAEKQYLKKLDKQAKKKNRR